PLVVPGVVAEHRFRVEIGTCGVVLEGEKLGHDALPDSPGPRRVAEEHARGHLRLRVVARARQGRPGKLSREDFAPDLWRGEAVDQNRAGIVPGRSEEHTSELQSRSDLVCRLLLE